MRQMAHAMMAVPDHDEWARDSFITSFKSHISVTVTPGNKVAMERRVLPAFRKEKGRDPASRGELRKAMEKDTYHQAWGSLMRVAQEQMWDSIEGSVARQLPGLIRTAKTLKPRGSLRLAEDLVLPRYLSEIDNHCMPGSYGAEVCEDDVRAGAIYDRGAFAYHLGARGAAHDANGRVLAAFLLGTYPKLKPRRILDMGCSVGHMTTGLANYFPDAEIHAIDIGAAMLRYAHARASALGKPIHFAQQSAEKTDYPDGHFDLIVSSNLFHETSRAAAPAILKECCRLLRKGGVIAHMEVPVRYADMALYNQVMRGWQTYYNGEPFWDAVCSTDMVALARSAGFTEASSGYVKRSADPVNDPRTFAAAPSEGNDYRWILTGTRR